MYSLKKRSVKFKIPAVLALGIIITLSACVKTKNRENSRPVGLSIVNASTKVDSAFIFVDNSPLSADPLLYSQNSGYYSINNLNHEINVVTNKRFVASGFGSFEEGKYFTLYITPTADTTILVATEDDVSKPQSGKGKIRFANMSYSAPAISAALEGSVAIASSTVFKAASPFVEVAPGSYNFDVRDAKTPDVSAYKFRGIKVESGKMYTIWGDGMWGDTTKKTGFDIHVFEHK